MMDVEDVRRLAQHALYRLVAVVERRSGDIGSHSRRTSALVETVAEQLGLSEARRDLVAHASLYHDIGKVAIPDRVLSRTGPLDDDERAIVETHTEIGSWLLAGRGCPLFDLAAEIALTHHERLDGSGYPHGLVAEQIGIETRIVTVCEVFDALTSHRTYRPAFTVTDALRMIVTEASTTFDPDVVRALTTVVPEWDRLCAA
jgi:putative two-component system response regulator